MCVCVSFACTIRDHIRFMFLVDGPSFVGVLIWNGDTNANATQHSASFSSILPTSSSSSCIQHAQNASLVTIVRQGLAKPCCAWGSERRLSGHTGLRRDAKRKRRVTHPYAKQMDTQQETFCAPRSTQLKEQVQVQVQGAGALEVQRIHKTKRVQRLYRLGGSPKG